MPILAPASMQHADLIARHLAAPGPVPADTPWLAHSLTNGHAGITLLHSERAHRGHGTWNTAHTWLQAAAAGTVSAFDTTGLYQGVAALAFALDAAAGTTARYASALTELDKHLRDLVHRKVAAATQRLSIGVPGEFREYDVFFGLVGLGALLARRDPAGSALERVLGHLVALTRPLRIDGTEVPGWWVGHDPHRRQSAAYPGGHANLGAAHGITGVLLLLANTVRAGISVDGQHEAITSICAFLDRWEQHGEHGPWWPQYLTLEDLRTGRSIQTGPGRPSWCYGAPGIARAQQIAAIATGDTTRARRAQTALTSVLTDASHNARLTDLGLCHGWAGTYLTGLRAALDAADPDLDAAVDAVAETFTRAALAQPSPGTDPGLLEGDAGIALALTAAADRAAPHSGWDACLLIS